MTNIEQDDSVRCDTRVESKTKEIKEEGGGGGEGEIQVIRFFLFFVLNAQPEKRTMSSEYVSPYEKAKMMRVEDNNLALLKQNIVSSKFNKVTNS